MPGLLARYWQSAPAHDQGSTKTVIWSGFKHGGQPRLSIRWFQTRGPAPSLHTLVSNTGASPVSPYAGFKHGGQPRLSIRWFQTRGPAPSLHTLVSNTGASPVSTCRDGAGPRLFNGPVYSTDPSIH